MKVKRKYIKRDPWITSGFALFSNEVIMTSLLNKAKLLRKKLSIPNSETINKYKECFRVFNKIKRAANSAYYTEMLEAR